jgi:dGTPase
MPYPDEAFVRRATPGPSGDDPDEVRSGFQRDRDRLLYSSAFRRLSGKSQVVASLELGSFHTRLTHSIKVAQVGRRIAERLQRLNTTDPTTPDCDLVEFACLAHDLGHPPFGHAGELALQASLHLRLKAGPDATHEREQAMRTLRLQLGSFEGNPQTLRIVSRLAHKWLPSDGESSDIAEWVGLDLTAASLDAICKYPWSRSDETARKWGCYGQSDSATDPVPGDQPALSWARQLTGASPLLGPSAKKSFEAQVMEWADDVAYAVHDVEDFYEAGLIPLERLLYSQGDVQEWEPFRDEVVDKWRSRGYPNFAGELVTSDVLDEARTQLMSRVQGVQSPGSFRGNNLDRRLAHKRTSGLINYFLAQIGYTGDPFLHNGAFQVAPEAEQRELLHIQCDMLKEMIWTFVIKSPSLASQQAGHGRIIGDLVAVLSETNGEELLPVHFREYLDDPLVRVGYQDDLLARLRVVSDYVASLTEQHAFALHRRITGIDPGGLRDPV